VQTAWRRRLALVAVAVAFVTAASTGAVAQSEPTTTTFDGQESSTSYVGKLFGMGLAFVGIFFSGSLFFSRASAALERRTAGPSPRYDHAPVPFLARLGGTLGLAGWGFALYHGGEPIEWMVRFTVVGVVLAAALYLGGYLGD
jgi:hypothetical protein